MTLQTSDTPVLDLLFEMNAASIEAAGLDPERLFLVRLAALIAVDAPAASYMLNLPAAAESGIDALRIRSILAAVAPIVGGPRVASATVNILRGLEIDLELAELQQRSAAE